MSRGDVDAPVADIRHDAGHDFTIALVALSQVVEYGRADDHFGSQEGHENFAGERQIIQILGGIQLCAAD